MTSELPYSPACDRNKEPLKEVLKRFTNREKLQFLELGFGTLQHARYFCEAFPQLFYFASDQKSYHPVYELNREHLELPKNLRGPYVFEAREDELFLDVKSAYTDGLFDVIFTANTLHIMGWPEGAQLLRNIHEYMKDNGHLLIYGPFKFNGEHTSESNHNFDLSLKERNPNSGIRNFEDIVWNLKEQMVEHVETIAMPANNYMLVFRKS